MKVSIVLSQINLPQAVPFYCMRCRSTLFTINRDILMVSIGTQYPAREIPKNMGWLDHRCHSCKTNYNLYWQ